MFIAARLLLGGCAGLGQSAVQREVRRWDPGLTPEQALLHVRCRWL